MAASGTEGGFECDFVSVPDDSQCCRICLCVARDPRQHGKCGQLYCYTCLQKYKQKNTRCPYCKEDNADFFEDNRSHRQIQSLIVRCSSKQDGCTWQGELRDLKDHTANKCDYRQVNCPLACDTTMTWITLDHHMKEECPKRLIKCCECGEEGPYWSITTDHKEQCLYILEKCPTPGCDVELCSVLMSFHVQTECEYSIVECKYRGVGCTTILPRRHMEEHENNDRYHLKLLAQSHTALREKCIQLEESETSLQEKYTKLLTKYDEQQESVASLNSKWEESSLPSSTFKISYETLDNKTIEFYATPQTYKLLAIIYSNICGNKICIDVIKGINDDKLDWPFIGKVKIEILNPMKNIDHVTEIINVKQVRRGHNTFVYVPKFADFSPDAIEKYKYNGDIYIRFTVISDLCKHWLK